MRPQRVLLAAQLMPLQRKSGLELTAEGKQFVPAIMSAIACSADLLLNLDDFTTRLVQSCTLLLFCILVSCTSDICTIQAMHNLTAAGKVCAVCKELEQACICSSYCLIHDPPMPCSCQL